MQEAVQNPKRVMRYLLQTVQLPKGAMQQIPHSTTLLQSYHQEVVLAKGNNLLHFSFFKVGHIVELQVGTGARNRK